MATTLQIPTPCTEAWSAMTPQAFDCRFCASCQKNVVDFTGKSDAEILAHLKKNAGNICGRFRAEQLNRPLMGARMVKRGGWSAVVASLIAMLSSQQPAKGQQVSLETIVQMPVNDKQPTIEKASDLINKDSVRTIEGKVIDLWTNKPLKGCRVKIAGTKWHAVTNNDGIFSIKIPIRKLRKIPLTLSISHSDYHSESIDLPEKSLFEDIALTAIEMESKAKDSIITGCISW